MQLLKKYLDKFYLVTKQRDESEKLTYKKLDGKHGNFKDEYTVKVPSSKKDLARKVNEIQDDASKRNSEDLNGAPARLIFDRHLVSAIADSKE